MEWIDLINERDEHGLLTPLALALDAIQDNGCDCGEDEPGTCFGCLCEAALRGLWERNEALRARVAELEAALCGEALADSRALLAAESDALRLAARVAELEAEAARLRAEKGALAEHIADRGNCPPERTDKWCDEEECTECWLEWAVTHPKEAPTC